MTRTTIILGSMVLGLSMAVSYGQAAESGGKSATHMKVSGVVSNVASGITTMKTPWGTMKIASTLTPKNLEVGEEVDMQVNENNAVIDVHRKGDKAHSHRFVTGNLAYTSPDKKEIKVWTPEGEKAIDVQTGKSKLSALEQRAPVTI